MLLFRTTRKKWKEAHQNTNQQNDSVTTVHPVPLNVILQRGTDQSPCHTQNSVMDSALVERPSGSSPAASDKCLALAQNRWEAERPGRRRMPDFCAAP